MIGLGTAYGMGHAGGAGARGPRLASGGKNLLRRTERVSDALWLKTFCTVTSGTGDHPAAVSGYGTTSDHVFDLSAVASVLQPSLAVALTGSNASVSVFDVATAWGRSSVSSTFDGLLYTFSAYLKADEAGVGLRIVIERAGGVIVCGFRDIGDVGEFYPWGMQLEVSGSATAYEPVN